MLEIIAARSGLKTARADGTHIHSPYDPRKEARRFVEQSAIPRSPSLILLLGAGLGYVYEELQRRFPEARVVVVFYSEALWAAFLPERPQSCWHPGQAQSLLGFLRSQIHELEAEGMVSLEWPASARLFPERAREAGRALHQLLREIRGTLVTTSALGKLCFRNSLLNFLGIERIFAPPGRSSEGRPTIIAASGPTLQQSIGFLAANRSDIELWALPSSVCFLLNHGLVPDNVILTDPGYYAASHLQCARSLSLDLTMPLSAAPGAWRISARVSLLSQDTPFERRLLQSAAIEAPVVPSQGTVSATAMLLALRRRKGMVVFAGLDFRYMDILSHARPNNFENWLIPSSDRLEPLHHQLFSLAAGSGSIGGSRNLALDTYAGWFAEIGGSRSEVSARIRRLHPSPCELPGITEISEQELQGRIRRASRTAAAYAPERRPLAGYPERSQRVRIARALLSGWIEATKRIAADMSRKKSLQPLMSEPESLSLIYFCHAAELTEMRRILRLQGPEAALGRGAAILQGHLQFLQSLSDKISEPI